MGKKGLRFQVLSFTCFYRLVPYKQPNVTAAVNPSTSGLMRQQCTVVRVRGCVRRKNKQNREMLNHLCIFAHNVYICTCVSMCFSAVLPLEGPSFPLGETLTALVSSAVRVIIETVP